MRPETLRRIRTAAVVGVALAGVGSVIDAVVEAKTINSLRSIERSVEKDVPGYNPEEFAAAQHTIVDFKGREDLTSNTIVVPENVRQAAAYHILYDKGAQLQKERAARFDRRFNWELVGGGLLAVFSALALTTPSLRKTKQAPEKARRNPAAPVKV